MASQSTKKTVKAGQPDVELTNSKSDHSNLVVALDAILAAASESSQNSLSEEVRKLMASLPALFPNRENGPRCKGYEFSAAAIDPARRLHAKLKYLLETDEGTSNNDHGLAEDFKAFIRVVDSNHPFLVGDAVPAAWSRRHKRLVKQAQSRKAKGSVVEHDEEDVEDDNSEDQCGEADLRWRVTAPIVADEDEKRATRHPIPVTRKEHTASMLVLVYTFFKKAGEPSALSAMADILEKAEPDFKYAPDANNPGLVAFYDFLTPLADEHAALVAQELKGAAPSVPNIQPSLIKDIHEIFRGKEDDSHRKLSDQLSYASTAFFLETCHNLVSDPFPVG